MVVNRVRNDKYLLAFGENLKKLRTKHKISRETLSAYAGIEVMQIYRIETGKINTTISTVLALSKGLEIAPKKLFEFEYT